MKYFLLTIKIIITSILLTLFNTFAMIGLPVLAANLTTGPGEALTFINVIGSMWGLFLIFYWAIALFIVLILLSIKNIFSSKSWMLEGYIGIALAYIPYIFSMFPKTLNLHSFLYLIIQMVLIGFVFNLIYVRFIKLKS